MTTTITNNKTTTGSNRKIIIQEISTIERKDSAGKLAFFGLILFAATMAILLIAINPDTASAGSLLPTDTSYTPASAISSKQDASVAGAAVFSLAASAVFSFAFLGLGKPKRKK